MINYNILVNLVVINFLIFYKFRHYLYYLGINYAKDIDWEIYEQNESLTTRIKNIIKVIV